VPNLLKQLELDELSLVDRPANAQAMVSLFKRDNSQEDDMTETLEKMGYDEAKVKAYMEEKGCGREEAMKALNMDEPMEKAAEEVAVEEQEVDKAAEVQAEVEALKAENERLRKSLIENGFVIKAETIEKKAAPEYIEYDGEQINKADIPAPILKALEEAEFAKADLELTKRATEALPHFAQDVAKSLVAEFGEVEAIMEALKAADATFAESMEEVGKSGAETEFATAADKLEALVKSHMDENKMKKSDYAKAYAAVAKTDEGKALINKSYKGE
jgi:Holliday junction resolvasome RuvABC DNA-binding subunit